jgi:acetylornithine/succinyldiaminopimelate/putrescine aminotransferase
MHRQVKLFLEHLAPTSPAPLMLHVARAKGSLITDIHNKRYIDLIAGISVGAVGHGHRHVMNALRRQMRRHLHVMVYGEFVQSAQVRLAEKLLSYTPAPLNCVYFVNSGSEATELAMKLARRATGRPHIAAFRQAYHGSTQGALSLIGSPCLRDAFRPLIPGIQHLEFNNLEDLNKIDRQTAAVFVEVIQAEAGCREALPEFMARLQERCTETGTLLVVDECQTGIGRTGRFWGFEHYGLKPDVILSAKALGGGLPLGAVVASRNLLRELAHKPALGHITTFGGHPLSCTAGLATLQILEKESLLEEAQRKGRLIRENFQHPRIKAIHGQGLLLALELDEGLSAVTLSRKALEAGLITDWFLFRDDCLRVAPALNIPDKWLKKAAGIINELLNSLT